MASLVPHLSRALSNHREVGFRVAELHRRDFDVAMSWWSRLAAIASSHFPSAISFFNFKSAQRECLSGLISVRLCCEAKPKYPVYFAYLTLDRLAEVKAAAQEARARNVDTPDTHRCLYIVDFLQHDRWRWSGMRLG
jgi:hypothetical protein